MRVNHLCNVCPGHSNVHNTLYHHPRAWASPHPYHTTPHHTPTAQWYQQRGAEHQSHRRRHTHTQKMAFPNKRGKKESSSHSKPFRNHRYDLWKGPSRLSKINSRKCWRSPENFSPRYTFPGSPWETWVAPYPETSFLVFYVNVISFSFAESPTNCHKCGLCQRQRGIRTVCSHPLPNETNWPRLCLFAKITYSATMRQRCGNEFLKSLLT